MNITFRPSFNKFDAVWTKREYILSRAWPTSSGFTVGDNWTQCTVFFIAPSVVVRFALNLELYPPINRVVSVHFIVVSISHKALRMTSGLVNYIVHISTDFCHIWKKYLYHIGYLMEWFGTWLVYSVSEKNPPKGLRIFHRFFTYLLRVPIYARLQIFIQLSPILMKLWHIKLKRLRLSMP